MAARSESSGELGATTGTGGAGDPPASTTCSGATSGSGSGASSGGGAGATGTSATSSSSGGSSCAGCAAGGFCWLGACVRLTAVSAGNAHTCALTTLGDVQCWGSNNHGQLGNYSTIDSHVPVAVTGLPAGVTAIAAGGYPPYFLGGSSHTCALTNEGSVLCWGSNDAGQLGNDSTTGSLVPVAVSGLSSGAAAVAAGGAHTCALTLEGGVLCWGSNGGGQLGNGSTMDSHVPVAVTGLSSGVVAIIARYGHTCAVTAAGGAQCWGSTEMGQPGDYWTGVSLVPVAIAGLSSGVAAITAGLGHCCALTVAGGVVCWGNNGLGQLGEYGGIEVSLVPVAVTGLSAGVVAIAAGLEVTCALTTAGNVVCWGIDPYTNSSWTPEPPVSGLSSGVSAIAMGALHVCALMTEGDVRCWGDNEGGDLGDDSLAASHVPVSVIEP